MAIGAYDREIQNRAFWMRLLGSEVNEQLLLETHPLRRSNRPAPPPPTPEQKAEQSKRNWSTVFEFFGGQYEPTPVSGD